MKTYWIFAFRKNKIEIAHYEWNQKNEANNYWLCLHRQGVPTYTETTDENMNLGGNFHDVSHVTWQNVTKYGGLFKLLDESCKRDFGSDYLGSRLSFSPELNAYEFISKHRRSDLDNGLYEEQIIYTNYLDPDSFFMIKRLT